ncbi:MAG: NUDIX domain-containing protein [Candidatus Shapirobacteria bacterium]
MDYPRLPLKDFMSIYHKVPRAAVDLIVKTEKGIILTKRSIPPYLGMWHIPGGTVLFKEPLTHAIDRIAQEELGIKVKITNLLGIVEYFNDDGRHTICNEYLLTIKSGQPRGSDQGKNWAYFTTIRENIIPEQGDFLQKHKAELLLH